MSRRFVLLVSVVVASLACKGRAPAPLVDATVPVADATDAPAGPRGGIAVGEPRDGGSTLVVLAEIVNGVARPWTGPCPPEEPLVVGGTPVAVKPVGGPGCRLDSPHLAEEPFVATWGLPTAPGAYPDGNAEERQRVQALALAALGQHESSITPDQFDVDSEVFAYGAEGRSYSAVELTMRPVDGCDSAACAEPACGNADRGALFLYGAGGKELYQDVRAPEAGRVRLVDFVNVTGQPHPWLVTASEDCEGKRYQLATAGGDRFTRAVEVRADALPPPDDPDPAAAPAPAADR